ncbi:MAG: hypothetical protein WC372_02165 [Candidatus Neomarinimicrobiota bacterium]|jgi:hypothetical protein|nr:hypothetical protein [Candidatus Neomarinimicrobiota bacterium]MDD3965773.1 hypothetical protein [Candidatus Neomarinimicrobiota bacterium]MDX9780633.1 hypothetical protein [bacterium]
MIVNEKKSSLILYPLLSLLFLIGIIFNDFIGIAGIRPDILLVFLFVIALRESSLIAIIAAFCFGLLQELVLPGALLYWGLSPLAKTLLVFTLLKTLPLILRSQKLVFFISLFGLIFVYYLFYNLLYYAGFINWLTVIYRYTVPESAYTFLILMLVHMIFPLREK